MSRPLTAKGIGAPDFVKDLRQVIYSVTSDKDTEFTGNLAKNGIERENITGLRSNRVRITKISIQCTQQLHFQLLFYGTDLFDETDLGDDRYVGDVELNMPLYGFTQTTSQYRMDLENVDLDYEDLDKTKELHVVLKNLSPTAKSVYPTTEVKLEFTVEARA